MLARDDFSAMLAVGLTVSLGLQTLIIAAGNVKLVPLTGCRGVLSHDMKIPG